MTGPTFTNHNLKNHPLLAGSMRLSSFNSKRLVTRADLYPVTIVDHVTGSGFYINNAGIKVENQWWATIDGDTCSLLEHADAPGDLDVFELPETGLA